MQVTSEGNPLRSDSIFLLFMKHHGQIAHMEYGHRGSDAPHLLEEKQQHTLLK